VGILGPKVQLVRRNGVQAAVGVYQGLAPGWSGGVGYGVVTLGSADTAATLGYGYGYGGLVDPGESASIVFAGVEKSLGRRFRLVFEGLFGGAGLGLPDQTLIGAARIGGGRWAVDVGVLVPVYETGAGTPFPLLTIAYRHPARR
jgi:hypothetical protein